MTSKLQFLENALENVSSCVWVLNSEMTTTLFANEKFLDLLAIPTGMPPESVNVYDAVTRLGQVFNSLEWQEGNTELAIKRLRETPSFEIIMKTSDSRHIKLERFPDKDGCAVINFTDVTALVTATEEAKKADVAKTDFLANMSHEIRTPMNGVVGMTQVLSMTKLDDQQQNYVDLIARSGKALVSIINDILDFSKLESGNFTIHEEPFNLKDTIYDIVTLMGQTARSKNLELILDMPILPYFDLVGDSGRLRQTLINLIGNAIKFTQEGYVKLSVALKLDETSATIDFSIADTGIGIDASAQESVFNQFQQADSSVTRSFGGTGLGLSISQQLVNLMGGQITLESKLGQGSTFAFTLEMPLSNQAVKATPNLGTLNKTPILYVDDLEINHVIMENQLSQIGATPIFAHSAATALNIMRKAAEKDIYFPLVITDFQMPKTNGLEFVEAVRKDPSLKDTPVMVLSAVDMAPYKTRFSELDVKSIHAKPCLIEDIQKAVFETIAEAGDEHLNNIARRNVTKKTTKIVGSPHKTRVLIVDDDEVNQEVVKQFLFDPMIECHLAENGWKAVELYKTQPFDIIFMDISMQIMDGLTAAQEIRKFETSSGRGRTPIVALTAYAFQDEGTSLVQSGMDGYLTKPSDKTELILALKKWTRYQSRLAA